MATLKEFIVKETEAYKLRVTVNDMLSPKDLRHLQFRQESYRDGVLTDTSTYEFFLTDAELSRLSQELRT